MDSNCVFCKIVSGLIPSHRVGENDGALAFLDIEPLADGHTLVIPKQHRCGFEDLRDGEVAQVFALAREVSRAQMRTFDPVTATTVGINNGRDAGQLVAHVHVHVVPRRCDDQGSSVHGIVQAATNADLSELSRRLGDEIIRSGS
ncbi:MAG: HIT domain-containing protein [Nannocystaceae bacterium]